MKSSNVNSSTSTFNVKSSPVLTHPFHIVEPSPWPILMSVSAFNTAIGLVVYMHRFEGAYIQLFLGFLNVLFILTFWWRDVIREATFEGKHTYPVQKNLKIGVALFIVSEVMFFFGFFWAYFHSSLAPTVQIGCVWPPVGITPVDAFGVPLLNTFILLTSGVTLTMAHHALLHNYGKLAIRSTYATCVYAFIFTVEQFFEYLHSSFNINDGIYGSTFYMLTGFHGFHVIIGTIFIIVCLIRLIAGHFTSTHHVGFESAAWYWHFVDVVWLALYVSVYWWGS